jgi:PBSX family phage terminase large subunit
MNKPAPFTMNQKAFYDRCFKSWFNVAEGGKRGGKNVLTTLAFCVKLETHPNRLHLIAGVTISAAKLNILDCDGYGLLNYFSGRCEEGKYQNRDCLYVQTPTGQKIILVSGGGKDGDQKLIQGNTYGMAYVTEANLCHQNFIKEVFDRTLSSKDRAIFHDLNPKAPGHWYYKDVLDYHESQQKLNPEYGYNYGHFTIADNMSVSDEQLKAVLATYDKNSVWYKRDIKGARIAAEGLIYRSFADDSEKFIIDEAPPIAFCNIGVDFGGNKSAHAFQCTGFERGFRGVVTLDEYYSKEEMDPAKLEIEFVTFVKKQIAAGHRIVEIFPDSAEQVLIRGLRNALAKAGIGIPVRNAIKGPIVDRIRFYNLLMGVGRYKVMRHCKHTIEAFSTALWDEEELDDTRLDDGTTNVDTLDAQEYSTEKYQKQVIDMIILGGDVSGNTGAS